MEEKFKNQHIRDKSVFKALAIYSMLRQPAILVFHIIFAIFCICGMIFNESWYLFAFAFVVYYLWIIFRSVGYVKTGVERDRELTTGEPVVHTMTFYDDKVVYENTNGTTIDIDYSIIKKAASTKYCYFLITNQKQFFTLKKDGFVIGEEKDFLSFMKEKCDGTKK